MDGVLRLSLASVALAGLLSAPAMAQGLTGGTWYLRWFGGATLPQSDDFDLTDRIAPGDFDSGLSYDTGYILGLAAGVEITPNIAGELEYAYRRVDANLKHGAGVKTESNALMVNALYRFTPLGATGQWRPYVGGGLGAADLNLYDFPGGGIYSGYNVAYQVIGGIGYAVTPNVEIVGELRFFGINEQTVERNEVSIKTDYRTIDLLFGAIYSF